MAAFREEEMQGDGAALPRQTGFFMAAFGARGRCFHMA